MKIRPVILCGGSGTRLWTDKKHHQPKQFIDFGNWTLFGKTLERIKNSIFDYPIISTNKKYIREIKKHLRLKGFKKYKIILEPAKRNTAPAILSSALIKEIPENQPLIFLTSDHLIEKTNLEQKRKSNLMILIQMLVIYRHLLQLKEKVEQKKKFLYLLHRLKLMWMLKWV